MIAPYEHRHTRALSHQARPGLYILEECIHRIEGQLCQVKITEIGDPVIVEKQPPLLVAEQARQLPVFPMPVEDRTCLGKELRTVASAWLRHRMQVKRKTEHQAVEPLSFNFRDGD